MSYRVVYGETIPAWEQTFPTLRAAKAFARKHDDVPDFPQGVYWSREAGNFYDAITNRGMGLAFYNAWQEHKDRFPEKATTTPCGLDLYYNKPVELT